MATDLERLIVSLEARTNAFEKAMKRAVAQSDQSARKIEQRFAKLNFGKDVFGPFIKGAIAGLAPILSVAAAVDTAKRALKDFGDIADNSAAAGLDPELFQSLTYQFQQVGVEAGASASALATFAKNSGLAVEGKGRMVTALKALDVELLENIRSATTQAERIRLVADALAATDDPARKAAIATAAFGEAGLKMVAAFEDGATSIDTTMRKARELGIVVDRDLIARADELGDEFETATQILDVRLKQALVNLAAILTWLTGLASNFAAELQGAIEDAKNFRLPGQPAASIQSDSTQRLKDELERLRTAPPQKFGFDLGPTLGGVTFGGVDQEAVNKRIRELEREIFRRADNRSVEALKNIPVAPTLEDLPTLEEIDSQNDAATAAIKHGEAVQQLISDLQFEQEQIGRTALEQDIMNELRRVGVDRMSEEGQKIADLITGNDALRTSMERNKEMMEEFGDVGLTALEGIINALEDGKIEASEFGDVLLAAISAAADFFFPGSGRIVSAVGGLFKSRMAANENAIPDPALPTAGIYAPRPVAAAGSAGAAGRSVVEVVLRDEMLDARITQQAGPVAAKVTNAGIATYDRGLHGRMAEKSRREG